MPVRGLLAALLVVVSALHALSAHAAEPTNFNYTTLSVGLGKTKIEPASCVLTDCYTDLGAAQFGGSYQFADGLLVVSLNASGAGKSTQNTSLAMGSSALGLNLVKAIASKVDVTVGIASLSAHAEACVGSLCSKTTDTGTGFNAGIQAWFDDARSFAGSLMLTSAKLSNNTSNTTGSTLGLGYYITKNHQIGLAFGHTDSGASKSSSSMLTYTYHFNTGAN